ncbi:hypothetical protein HZS_5476 [Henneguya salminicola]|nr:hypothetical protein HZS_5476 [Henneguya salminicola]
MCDFELASINSFNQRNFCCELAGFFFQLSQCMWRKIQEKDNFIGRPQKYPIAKLIGYKYMESI